jgi:hypothetical protein
MRDRPNGAELLAEAGRVLSEELAPTLSGAQRYKALLVAAAVGMVRRELEAGDAWQREELAGLQALLGKDGDLEALSGELAAALRAGTFDADARVHKLLRDSVIARVRETNPKALDATE